MPVYLCRGHVFSALEFTATVVIFVARQREQEDNPLMAGESLDLDLGWSFYVGLGALLSAWIAAGANMKEGCLLRRDDAPYENLWRVQSRWDWKGDPPCKAKKQ